MLQYYIYILYTYIHNICRVARYGGSSIHLQKTSTFQRPCLTNFDNAEGITNYSCKPKRHFFIGRVVQFNSGTVWSMIQWLAHSMLEPPSRMFPLSILPVMVIPTVHPLLSLLLLVGILAAHGHGIQSYHVHSYPIYPVSSHCIISHHIPSYPTRIHYYPTVIPLLSPLFACHYYCYFH